MSLVRTWLSLDVLQEVALLQRFPVIRIPRDGHEIEDLTFIVDYQARLETEEPSHEAFPTLGKPLKCFMNHNSSVTACP